MSLIRSFSSLFSRKLALICWIGADTTSVPLLRVGGPVTPASSVYARFARRFEHTTGKDTMYFKLHDNFFKNKEPKVVTVHVYRFFSPYGRCCTSCLKKSKSTSALSGFGTTKGSVST